MRISAPWIGLPLESFTKPLSPADPCALTFSIKQNETNPIATTRMSIFMLQEYDFGRVCKTRPDPGNLPAEGLEPTRSCDHWILSPARLPFRHAGVSKGSERIRSSRPSSNASDQIERLQTARWPENFAQNNRVPQTGCRSYQRSDVDSYFRRLSDTLG